MSSLIVNRAALPVPPPGWEPSGPRVRRDVIAGSLDDLADIEARLLARRAECAAFEEAFRHSLETDPPKIFCPQHPTERMPIDVDASVRKSWDWLTEHGERKRRFVLIRCASCQRAIDDARLREWMLRAGVPANLVGCSLENFYPRNSEDGASYKIVCDFASKRSGVLVLISPGYGCGKSHLAVACMRVARGGIFRKQSTLLQEFRAGYKTATSERIQERMSTTKLLVLDEIGLSVGGKDELPLLHDILDARYATKLPTILTGNLRSANELEQIFGPRMMDRLKEMLFAVVKLTAPSERTERNGGYVKVNSLHD